MTKEEKIDEDIEEFIKDNNLGIQQTFRLKVLINQVKLESHDRGMDRGEEIIKNTYNL